MEPTLEEMTALFERSNRVFLSGEASNIVNGTSERCLCGALMLRLRGMLDQTAFSGYYVDIEYNRNQGGMLKTIVNGSEGVVPITCDLIIHSRGENLLRDNLMAIELKRNTHSKSDRDSDKLRLKCLTKDSFDDVWSYDGTTLPEHVCRYILGVYYEINKDRRTAQINYYAKGRMIHQYSVPF